LLTLEHWQMHALRLLQEHVTVASCRFFVFSPDETHIIGTVGLSQITRGVRFDCSLSYAISAACEGQGVMREAVQAAIKYAFDELGLHRIEAAHAPENTRSARLLARLGFETVGTIPEYLYTGERWRDTILCTLVNTAWKAPGTVM
jgi:ribosomal-protein-alanine N-acetyltransferase